MFISIIIPIYKVEKYIRGTLESIYDQKFDEHEFEIICVNDGTPDNSMQIVNEFAFKHNNLHIINQENQGLSCARNAGLRIAQGDYIWFVDSDDKITSDAFDVICECTKRYKTDILGFDIMRISEGNGTENIQKILFSKQNLYSQILQIQDYFHCIHIAPVQRFVFNKKFIEENKLSFCPGIIHEDMEFMGRCIILNGTMTLINKILYLYLIRSSGSIMSTLGMKSLLSRFKIIDSFTTFPETHCTTFHQRRLLDSFKSSLIFGIIDFINAPKDCQMYVRKRYWFIKHILLKCSFSNIYLGYWLLAAKNLVAFISFRLYLRLKKYMWKSF